MGRAFIGIGSNEGDRLEYISKAIQRLRGIPGIELDQMATIFETKAVGPPQPDYLNTAISIHTTLEPRQLFERLKGLERELGRAPSPQRYGPRIIDLDLLMYDDRMLNEPDLVIPHPRMHERRFVLQPLAQLAPNVVHPVLKKTISQLLDMLPSRVEPSAHG